MLVQLACIPRTQAQDDTEQIGPAMRLGFVLPEGQKRISVPFEVHNNLIVITVLLNNALPLKFILDTGVRTTVLTEKSLTDLLNLTYSRIITIPGVGGEKLVDAYVANNVTLNINGLIGRGHSVLVLERDLLQLKNYLGVSVHGILGYELFSRFIVEINYDRKQVTFHKPESYRKRKSFDALPLMIEDTKPYYYLDITIRGGKTYRGKFMLDTGASHSLMIDERSSSELYIPDPHLRSNLGRGLGGDIMGEIARVDHAAIEQYEFDDVITTFPDAESYMIDFDTNYRNGTIGGGMMSRFKITFDFISSTLYIKKGNKFGKSFEFNLSGIIVRASGIGLEDFMVAAVRDGSAAARAGIEIGDQILVINGQNAQDLELNNVVGILNSKKGKRISMLLMRNGQKISKRFRLERLI
jgi:hypothetical protein